MQDVDRSEVNTDVMVIKILTPIQCLHCGKRLRLLVNEPE